MHFFPPYEGQPLSHNAALTRDSQRRLVVIHCLPPDQTDRRPSARQGDRCAKKFGAARHYYVQ